VRTLFKGGCELRRRLDAGVHDRLREHQEAAGQKRQDWIWDKIIYANPTKPTDTLEQLKPVQAARHFDNLEEIHKIKQHAPNAGLALRLKVPNTGAMVELSSKFGALARRGPSISSSRPIVSA